MKSIREGEKIGVFSLRDAANAGLILNCKQPAMILSPTGKPLCFNGGGQFLVDLVTPEPSEALRRILEEARNGAVVTTTAAHPETQQRFELTSVPIDSEQILILGREASLDPRRREMSAPPQSHFKDLIEMSSDLVWEIDKDGTFGYVSPCGAFGYRAQDLIGQKPQFMLADDTERTAALFASHEEVNRAEVRLKKADGSSVWVQVYALPIWAEDGSWQGLRGVFRDITVEREKDALLVVRMQRDKVLDRIVSAFRDQPNPEAMLDTAAETVFNALEPTGLAVYRYDSRGGRYIAAARGATPADIAVVEKLPTTGGLVQLHKTRGLNVLKVAIRYRNRDNGVLCMWHPISGAQWNSDDQDLVGNIANQLGVVLEQLAHHEEVLNLSRTDALTGLLNRRAFINEEVPRRIHRLRRSGQGATLIYMDLDNFKKVNDAHGHQQGDKVLLALRDILLKYTRPGDLTARLGGDEFVIWLDNIGQDAAVSRAEQLLTAMGALGHFSGGEAYPLGLSVGIARFDPKRKENLDQLLARADAAMYEAKRKGKGDYSISPLDLA